MHDRDRLLDAVDLAGLADETLGDHHGPARNPTWPCPNPNHAQTGRTPPVTIFQARSGDQRWHCHGCGAGGTAIDLVIATQHTDVRGALDLLAARTGIRPDDPSPPPLRRCRPPSPPKPDRVTDPDGLGAYVDSCARRLWAAEGKPVLRWLTRVRGLPPDVLRLNRIGADPGSARQERPKGMPAAGWAAVLPVHENGEPVFAQLRRLGSAQPRYLNASTDLAPNPRVAIYEPVELQGPCVVVTEGIIDALSAAAAGYRSAAVLGAAIPDPSRRGAAGGQLVTKLTGIDGRLVIAFDTDEAGLRGAKRLQQHLGDAGRQAIRLGLPEGTNDLNDWMRAAGADWPRQLAGELRTTIDLNRTRSIGR